jgi:predicted metal-dependent HD superfamily phosphohydrolase
VLALIAAQGAPLQRYAEYAVAVRQEYSHLSDTEYCTGRARVLKALLDREQLFLTDVGKSACEAAARANMSHEWRLAFGGQLLQTNSLGECL